MREPTRTQSEAIRAALSKVAAELHEAGHGRAQIGIAMIGIGVLIVEATEGPQAARIALDVAAKTIGSER